MSRELRQQHPGEQPKVHLTNNKTVFYFRRRARYGYHAPPPPPHTYTHISTKLSFLGALGYTEHEVEC